MQPAVNQKKPTWSAASSKRRKAPGADGHITTLDLELTWPCTADSQDRLAFPPVERAVVESEKERDRHENIEGQRTR
ncbi:hypothetical protein RR46_02762 [Papilio xuthus]|uniref:Uncharacterized protein n=1 Tax=Papilio xuthus TaxID=66420 RepID=A0A194Q4U5_PAPXU|nr:hypothetical protein RR46_02762 [Papilio xuthus]